MTPVEFAMTVTDLPADQQNAFFERLKGVLSEEEYKATLQYIGFFGMIRSPEKFKAIRSAVCEAMFGVECPDSAPSMWVP